MRLERMTVAGFRGFASEVEFDLDADVILLSGPNGAGKTSFFDAILWGLTGAVERVGSSDVIVNRFSEFGEARVEIHLRDELGSRLQVVRRFGGSESLAVQHGDDRRAGTAAQALILERLWPDGQGSNDPVASFSQSLTKSVYLEQDRVSAFVEADNEQTRFDVVGELVGAGRLGELSRQLEAGRRAWTKATNRMVEEVQPTVRQIGQIEARLSEISGREELEAIEGQWLSWSKEVSGIVESVDAGLRSESRAAEIDSALESLGRSQRITEAQLRATEQMILIVAEPPPQVDESESSAPLVADLGEQVSSASTELQRAEEVASAARRERLAEADERQSLGALAQLALRHLDDVCPVCTQVHDRAATTARLQGLVDGADLQPEIVEDVSLKDAADSLRDLELQLGDAQAKARENELASRRRTDWQSQVSAVASDAAISLDPPPSLESLEAAATTRRNRVEKLRELRHSGEQLSVSLARLGEAAEAGALHEQLSILKSQLDDHEIELHRRNEAAGDAQQLHDAIRSISESLVVDELKRIEPLLQKIYATVDPHPAFRVVRFLTKMHRGRGRLWTVVEATAGDETITIDEPRTVLSSSQLNVLAVAAFLSLNLSVPAPPLSLVALDDPLQSLDNVNLLGLCDLLRRLRGRRQVFLSTHDERLANLLERKLRPVGAAERTVLVSLSAWDRSGPKVKVTDVTRDDAGLRLVSA